MGMELPEQYIASATSYKRIAVTIHFETFSNGMEMLKHRTARGITKAINFWLEIIPPSTELLKRCRQHCCLSIC